MTITQSIEDLKIILVQRNAEISEAQLEVFTKEPHDSRDWFNIAMTQMVHSNIAAFICLSEHHNHLAAMAIIRMHLDCLLRLFSIFIISPTNDWINLLLQSSDSPTKKKIIVGGKKQSITDKFLCEQLTNQGKYPKAYELYQYASYFIHPSDKHFSSAVTEWKTSADEVQWKTSINIFGLSNVSDDIQKSNYVCMLEISDEIIKYIKISKSDIFKTTFEKFNLI